MTGNFTTRVFPRTVRWFVNGLALLGWMLLMVALTLFVLLWFRCIKI